MKQLTPAVETEFFPENSVSPKFPNRDFIHAIFQARKLSNNSEKPMVLA